MTNQPNWKLLANLGDVNPIEYGGYFIYEDTTGVYAPEAEVLDAPEDDDGTWYVHRFALDRLKMIDGYLVPMAYAPDWPHAVSQYDEWFHADLASVADSVGTTVRNLREELCSVNPIERAQAYRDIGQYHGMDNFDSYPLTLNHAEVLARYKEDK